ncbi:putative amidoligase enzyme-domain-containing protein [Rhypophila decipiens]|uniref:Amidoligase enzyme-domain-containing protein n=1 Tax=Rhypophila decipiens TaxID=261697 RepID=A0AAN6XWP8_9PEZI|nr:putative amidoligase enzyme-domain-containing protein [Rhypophila decipiens]
MATSSSFQFGVELELLLASRKKSHPNWKALARDLSKRLAKAGIANHVNEGNDKSRDNYREWSIVQEITIPSQPAKNLWGIELVSPIYPVYSYWAADLSTIFSVVQSSAYNVVPSANCSTHVHISGTPVPFSAQELAALAKCALYFEPALDLLVPSGRRGSTAYWCQSNRANPALRRVELDSLSTGGTGGLASCLGFLDGILAPAATAVAEEGSCDDDSPGGSSTSFTYSSSSGSQSSSTSYSPPSSSSSSPPGDCNMNVQHQQQSKLEAKLLTSIISTMNLFPANSAYGRSHGKKKDFLRGKVYKWDFTGMLPSSSTKGENAGRGTVEFRQPPGSLSAEGAAGWITLALAFVVGAMAVGPRLGGGGGGGLENGHAEEEEMNGASPDELWELLSGGAEVLGWESLGAVEGLFARMG